MFQGSMVALITPFRPDNSIDWHSLEALINWHIAQGTQAIVSVGTTGESATLNFDEHKAVMRFTVDIVNKRLPVMAGAGGNSTSEAIELALSAYQAGCDGTLQVTPYYNKPTQRGLFLHYQSIAQAAPLPLVLYNVPSRTGVDLLPETVLALAKVERIIGIKEASNFERQQALAAAFGDKREFLLFSGEDKIVAEAYCQGLIDGAISVTANILPKEMAQLSQLSKTGEFAACRALNEQIDALHRLLFCQTNPIPVKWALKRMGKISSDALRLPLLALEDSYHAELEAALAACKLI